MPINAATAAYSNAARLINQAAKPLEGPAGTGGQVNDFAKVLADTVQGMVRGEE